MSAKNEVGRRGMGVARGKAKVEVVRARCCDVCLLVLYIMHVPHSEIGDAYTKDQ